VMAKPLFGTTATHVSALYALWGPERAREWLLMLKRNGVLLTDGNASVVRLVATGERQVGLTDTDDVFMALAAGRTIAWKLIGQDDQTPGPMLIPNTVTLIDGGPNPENGRKLIDYLLSADVEAALAASRSRQIPLHAGLSAPEAIPDFEPARIDFHRAASFMNQAFRDIKRDLL
jgi:iron(III) transport system substrate-binding protein